MKKKLVFFVLFFLLILSLFYFYSSQKQENNNKLDQKLPKPPVIFEKKKEELKVPQKIKVQDKKSVELVNTVQNLEKEDMQIEQEAIEIEPLAFEIVEQTLVQTMEKQKDSQSFLVRIELEKELEKVYKFCNTIEKRKQTKKNIKDKLLAYRDTSPAYNLFLADYDGDTLLGENNETNIEGRSIVLEQVQKVRKDGEGFIVSDVNKEGLKRYIAVKKLNMARLYIGIDIYKKDL